MPRALISGVALAMSLLLFSPQSLAKPVVPAEEAEEIAQLEQRSRDSFENEKWASVYVANLKLNKLRPGEVRYLADAVRACAMLDRKSSAYHIMLQMQQQGMTHDFNQYPETEGIRNTEAYAYINDMLIDAGKPSGTGAPLFTLDGAPSDFSSIAWDPRREKFLMGTLSKGAILAVGDDGEQELLAAAGVDTGWWSITGLAIDEGRDRLWAVTTATPAFAGLVGDKRNQAALLEFDLESMQLLARYDAPPDGLPHGLGGVAVSDDGSVYVINSAAPVIYRKAPDSDALLPFFSSPELRQLSGVAVTGDNARLFVSDTVKGVMVIDPVAEQATFLRGPETMNLSGASGVAWRNGKLFVLQGSFEPQRIIRLDLDPTSGSVVEAISPMANALEAFDRPAIASMRGNELIYIANSGKADEDGVVIISTPLDAGSELAPPDLSPLRDAVRSGST